MFCLSTGRWGKVRWLKVRAVTVAALVCLVLAGCGSGADSAGGNPANSARAESQPPNIVILIADDLGWDDIGAYGNPDAVTPAIDALASDGVRFTRAFLTTSSCSASRASILTGQYPQTNGLVHLHQGLAEGHPLLTDTLRDAGYFTAAAGKWHIGHEAKSRFDVVREDRVEDGTRHFLPLLRERPQGQPFFMWLASRDPHRPHKADERFTALYDRATVTLPPAHPDKPNVRERWVAYLALVSRFDAIVGDVVNELREQGVLDNTVIVVMSDNGRPFHLAKKLLYDDGIKTPFIVHWPDGIANPGDYDGLFSAVDIAPTMLALAGQEVPGHMQGLSYATVLADRALRPRDRVFAVRNWHGSDAHERAVRTEVLLYKENQQPLHGDCLRTGFGRTVSWKALHSANRDGLLDGPLADCFNAERPLIELFDLSAAPQIPAPNVADDPAYAAARDDLAQSLRAWREATADFDFAPYTRPPQ